MIYQKILTRACQLFLLLPLIPVLTGCGQPGPLYLPPKTQPVQVDAKPKPPTETETPKDK
ncbi:MAG: LPS translocon maturation chaperone LptM [Methylococcaceae bacterium]